MEVKRRKAVFFKEDNGTEPLKEWLEQLLKPKRSRRVEHSKITTRINRAEMGNFGDHKILGENWGEIRIDFGPGYRIYFGVYEDELMLLLHGGTKQNQQEDIKLARDRWERYLQNKKESTDEK
ncbi:MAG: type II toxin-antitoxin system RelE/ParE family toxin [Pseudomonadota bacterium]|nr:type II toxin-antitoxin system RelE/ParE family toxin [Pseudomonadota bacterium]